ncbi:MAG TPA: DUF1844 domain-containing protein [Candidatus Acidoferrales bacterium]|nr:DUF1844 domain-containing protein [Candidatus Acidoferrales bacterium]
MADPKQDETFRVVDRRLFTQEGDLRKDVAEAEDRERQEQGAAKNISAKPAPAAEKGLIPDEPAKAPDDATGDAAEKIPPSREFQMLVDFMTRNAAAMLGGMTDPRTGQAFVDMDGAREVIDMMDALREKTRGNLAKADEDLLIEVIGSLKLTFMEISKVATEQMSKKAKGKA